MNRAMYLACAVILCALPSAFGFMCNHCTPNETALNLCTDMAHIMNKNCSENVTDCATTTIYAGGEGLPNVTSYVRDCIGAGQNCTTYETAVCTTARTEAGDRNATIFSCKTECCSTEKCNGPPPTTPASTQPPSGTGSSGSTKAPSDAATRSLSQPGFFFVIMAVYFGLK